MDFKGVMSLKHQARLRTHSLVCPGAACVRGSLLSGGGIGGVNGQCRRASLLLLLGEKAGMRAD